MTALVFEVFVCVRVCVFVFVGCVCVVCVCCEEVDEALDKAEELPPLTLTVPLKLPLELADVPLELEGTGAVIAV